MAFRKLKRAYQGFRTRRANRSKNRLARRMQGLIGSRADLNYEYAQRRTRRRKRTKKGFQIAGLGLFPLAAIAGAIYYFVPSVKIKVDSFLKKK